MTLFWIGLAVGLFLGAPLGMMGMALAVAAARGDRR
jgi:uncharacterized RDD family membrane protein YckC